jgi:uridylate kinase
MDMTAFTMGMDNRLPIVVFNVTVPGNLARALRGETVGTRVLVEV